ncbi:MAG: Methyl-accepting chemotaxis protein, partial [Pseudomonadota bacterium]
MNSSLLNRILAPGVLLMRRWTLSTRFAWISGVASAMVIVLAVYGGLGAVSGWRSTRLEIEGVGAAEALNQLNHDMHDFQLAARQVQLGAWPSQGEALQKSRQALQQAVQAVEAQPMVQSRAELKAVWGVLHTDLNRALQQPVAQGGAGLDLSAQVAALRKLSWLVGETSTLLLDPDLEAFALMLVVVDRLPPLADTLARLRDLTLEPVGAQAPNPDRMAELHSLRRLLRSQSEDVAMAFGALQRAGKAGSSAWTSTAGQFANFENLIERQMSASSDAAERQEAYKRGGVVLDSALAFSHSVRERLLQNLNERRQFQQIEILAHVVAAAFTMLIMGYLMMAMHTALTSSMAAMTNTIDNVSQGDLTRRMEVVGQDEIAHVGHGVNAMAGRISSIVATIRSNAVLVANGSKQLGDGAMALAQRTEAQSRKLTETADGLRHIRHAMSDNQTAANELLERVDRLQEMATEGQEAMPRAEQSMLQIESGSQSMREIVSMIEDIAFQTNMLA